MRKLSKATKLVLSLLLIITCINLSTVRADDNGVSAQPEDGTMVASVEDVSDAEGQSETETLNAVVDETTENTNEQENTQQEVVDTSAETPNVTENVTEEETKQEETTLEENKEEETTEKENEVVNDDSRKEETIVSETTEQVDEDASEEKTVDTMSSDELFAYIMTLDAEQLDALYDEYENLDDLMANFSEEQQAQLADHFGNSEEDIEVARWHSGKEENISASVGDTIDLQGSDSPKDEKYYHAWKVESGKEVVSLNNWYGSKGICYAKAEGKAVVRHYYTQNLQWYYYDEFTINITKPVKAYVYVNGKGYSDEALKLLGIDKSTLDNNGYFPVGEITVSANFFNGKNKKSSSMINSEADWSKLLSSLKDMKTDTLTGKYAANKGNSIASYLKQATGDLNQYWGSGLTNFGYFKDTHYGFEDQTVDYHLDLHFNTSVIKYVTGNNGISTGKAADGTQVDERTYINGSTAIEPENLTIPSGYKLSGYYSDYAMTQEWIPGKTIVSDETNPIVYIKIVPKDNVIINYVSLGSGTVNDKSKDDESFNPETGEAKGAKASASDGYYFVGWYSEEACTNLVSEKDTFKPSGTWSEGQEITYYAKFEAKHEITVQAKSDTVIYDGEIHTIAADELEKSEFIIDGVTYTVSATTSGVSGKDVKIVDEEVSSYPNAITEGSVVVKDSQNIDVTNKFKITVENGSLTINKRAVTLTSESATKVYDGKELTKTSSSYYYRDSAHFVDGEISELKAIGSITNVGTEKNSIQYTPTSKFIVSNYVIDANIHAGTLKVTPVKDKVTVTIKGNTNSTATYTGAEQQVTGYTVESIKIGTEDTKLYTTGDFKYNKEENPTAMGTDVDTYTMGLSKSDFENISKNFSNVEFVVTDGYITINPVTLTVTTQTASKVYDGTALTAEGSISGFVEVDGVKEWADFTTTGSQTEKGSSKNSYKITFSDEEVTGGTTTATENTQNTSDDETNIALASDGGPTAKSTNYTISDSVGTLTVTAQSLNPKKDDGTDDPAYKGITINNPSDVVYNGLEQKWEPTVKASSAEDTSTLVKGTDYTVSYSNDTKNVGTVTVTITGNGNYTGTVTRTYKITPATLYVSTPSASKVYDGTALATGDKDVSITGFVNNEWADIVATGSQTQVGYSKNTYKVTFADRDVEGGNETTSNTNASNNNESDIALTSDGGPTALSTNYTIVGTDVEGHDSIGTLTVTEYANQIVVTTTGGTFTYDGQEHGATVTVGTLPTGYHVEGTPTSDTTATNVNGDGVSATCDNLVIKNAQGVDVTSSLKITKVSGTIKVTPATVTVTTPDASKTYDGTPLTAVGTYTGLVNNETVSFTTTGSQTDKGSSNNSYSLVWDGTAQESNYTVSQSVGTLTVTAKNITPDAEKTGIVVNDPSNHEYDGQEHKEVLTVTDTKTGKDLVEGTDYEVSYSTEDFKNVGTITITVTGKGNYTGSFIKSYEITHKAVVVKANNNGKVYGNADPTLYATKTGAVKGEESKISYNIAREAGEKVGNYTITVSGATVQGNYTVSYENGTFTIIAKSIVPDDNTGIKVNTLDDVKYNGASQQQRPEINDTKTSKTLVEGTDYEVTYSEDTTNAGQVTVTITGIGNYTGEYTVTYNILKRDVTFTSPSASKTYDGSALTSTEIAISGEGFVEGEGASFNVTGTATEVGEVDNTFDYAMNEGTNADNYNVTVVNGKLTITAAPVVPSNDDTTPTTPVVPATTPTRRTTPVTPAQPEVTPTETPEATVEPTATPEATATPEVIDGDETPEVAPKGNWALINLIAAMLSVLLGVIAILAKHKDEDEDEEDETEDENVSTRHRRWKIVSAIDAIVAVVAFILTEDITQKMVMVDKWTILMVVIAVVGVVSMYFARKWQKEDEETSEDAQ